MKITSLRITNTKSFKKETSIPLSDGLNIFVGPNGGGKSNLLDILTVIFRGNFWKNHEIVDREDAQGRGKYLKRREIFGSLGTILEPFGGDIETPRRISADFQVSEEDVENISLISLKRTDLEKRIALYKEVPLSSLSFVESWQGRLSAGMTLHYEFLNGDITAVSGNSPESIFWQYLRELELFMILSEGMLDAKFYHPFLFFSAYRSAGPDSLAVRLSADNFQNYMWSYFQSTSKTATSLFKTAALYFASKKRSYEFGASAHGYQSTWDNDPEVKQVSSCLKSFGYSWDIDLLDTEKNDYRIKLAQHGKDVLLGQASSGEKEVLNFLLGICAFNVRNGVLLIDEPELHLHPKWQGLLREMLLEISKSMGNQIILATHSPVFIHPSTVGNVVRIYKEADGASKATKGATTGNAKDIVHIVNSHNNEKLFFADKVVLVEGIQDRLVFSALLNYTMKRLNRNEVIEVIEVHGTKNFSKYKDFLVPFGVDVWIIADRDYLGIVAKDTLSSILEPDIQKIEKKVLKDKKSRDRAAIADAIEKTLETNDCEALKQVWPYIKGRYTKIKSSLTEEQTQLIASVLEQQRLEKTLILCQGEIEDYLPEESRDLDGTIKLVSDANFYEKMACSIAKDRFEEIEQIMVDIIGVTPKPDTSEAVLNHRAEKRGLA